MMLKSLKLSDLIRVLCRLVRQGLILCLKLSLRIRVGFR